MDVYREVARRRHEQHLRQQALVAAPGDSAALPVSAQAALDGMNILAEPGAAMAAPPRSPPRHALPSSAMAHGSPHDEESDAALARRLAEEDEAIERQHAEDAAFARRLEEEDQQQRQQQLQRLQRQPPQQQQLHGQSAAPIVISDDNDGDEVISHSHRMSSDRANSQQEAEDAALARRLQAELSGGEMSNARFGRGGRGGGGKNASDSRAMRAAIGDSDADADDDGELVSAAEAQGDTRINADGVIATQHVNICSVSHARSGLPTYFCGRYVGDDGYAFFCGRCDGICGPRNGCQCHACFALDHHHASSSSSSSSAAAAFFSPPLALFPPFPVSMLDPAAAHHHHNAHREAHLQQHARAHAAHAAMHAANVGASSNARQQAFRERVEALRRGRLSGEDSGIDRPFALIQELLGSLQHNLHIAGNSISISSSGGGNHRRHRNRRDDDDSDDSDGSDGSGDGNGPFGGPRDALDVDNMTYEQLLALQEAMGVAREAGASSSRIQDLPTRVFHKEKESSAGKHPSSSSSSSAEQQPANCVICMSDFEEGEVLRTLPCFHFFHSSCVDEWLKRNSKCPVCRVDAGRS